MRVTQFSLLTGFILTVALALVTIILVPSSAWGPLAVSSFVLVLATFGSTWGVPYWLAYRNHSNAATIGTLGPAALILGVAVVAAIAAFLLALTAAFKVALAAFVAGLALWLSGILVVAYTGSAISSADETIDVTRETGVLVNALSELIRKAPAGELRSRISHLVEFIQYGPTAHPEGAPSTKELMDLLLSNPAIELETLLPRLEVAAERRKSALLRARSGV